MFPLFTHPSLGGHTSLHIADTELCSLNVVYSLQINCYSYTRVAKGYFDGNLLFLGLNSI